MSATARSGPLGWLWLLSALFIVYGTTLPFAFDPEGHAAARLAHVGQTTPWALHAVDRLSVPDVVQNILLFVPFGGLGVLVWRRRGSTHPLLSMLAVVAFGALLSAGVETLQLFTIDRTACSAAVPRNPDRFADDNGQYGVKFTYFSPDLNNTEFGLYFLNYHSRLPLLSGVAVTNSNAFSARYFAEYPEDIELYGFSFNTTLEGSGIALQGEISYRPNQPLQIDDVELLFSALSPLNAVIPQPVNRFISQLGSYAPGEEIRGWERHEVSQFQFTATKIIGPDNWVAADQISAVMEMGFTKVWDLPDHSVLRYQGDGTDTGGGPDFLTGAFRNPQTLDEGFPTQFSWGYRLAGRADYNNAFGSPFTLSPRLAFNHDVNGITPGPGGNFLEGRRSLTVGVEANYLNEWSVDVSYTRFMGAGNFNLIHDRDFVAFTARYAF